jgi:hypothetical protein
MFKPPTMSTIGACTVRSGIGPLCRRVIACRAPGTGQAERHTPASRPHPIPGLSYGYAPTGPRCVVVRPEPFAPPRHRVCRPPLSPLRAARISQAHLHRGAQVWVVARAAGASLSMQQAVDDLRRRGIDVAVARLWSERAARAATRTGPSTTLFAPREPGLPATPGRRRTIDRRTRPGANSRRHAATHCACPEDRRRPRAAPRPVPQGRTLGYGINDRVAAQDMTNSCFGRKRGNPQHVACRTQPDAIRSSSGPLTSGFVRTKSERERVALRSSACAKVIAA